MEKLIKNHWLRLSGEPFAIARILDQKIHPEGLEIARVRFLEKGPFATRSTAGRIVSIFRGTGTLHAATHGEDLSLRMAAGVHLYLPPGTDGVFEMEPGAELVEVSSETTSQARGTKLLLRDETFLAACASGAQSLRWIFTPQYLSRRIFLHHDPVLLSRSGHPVSWFRTTMFDVAGLPVNEDGEPVFKMSYNSRTECNVCYDVQGEARVRMARHPYAGAGQIWDPWMPLDNDSTYHLNEAAGSPEEERRWDEKGGAPQFFRNKHEVHITGGYVTLCCLFDPAPTGVERHQPGEYSDYEPLAQVIGTKEYELHRREIARYDEMVDQLSLAKAMGMLDAFKGTPVWAQYVRGAEAQAAIETEVVRAIHGNGRAQVLAPWMQDPSLLQDANPVPA